MTPNEKAASGCNHLAGLNTQSAEILAVLAVLERIAVALEKSCELATVNNHHLLAMVRSLDSMTES
jgi:hypothetical protein